MLKSFFCHPRLALILALCLFSSPAFAAMERMITVSGEANEEVAPDQAILTVSLVSRDRELANAKRDNDQKVEKIVAIAREFKIAKEKIANSNVYISPEYNYVQNKQVFVGYVVNRTLTLTITDISIHERVLSAIVDAKIDQVNGVQFTLAEPEKLAKNVRVKAVANAREKAAALAEAAGAKLGQVINISTAGVAPPMQPMPMVKMAMRAEMADSSVAPSLPGMITLQESVTVTYALE